MMPNPPVPTELKRKRGNPGKRKLPNKSNVVALVSKNEIPTPPRILGHEGTALWNRVWANGKTWISDKTDVEHVLILCETMDERTLIRANVLRGTDWRDRVALRSLDAQITSMLSALAFNPLDRTRMGVGEVAIQSRLEAIRGRENK